MMNQSFDVEKCVDFLDRLVAEHTGEPLNSVQKAIVRGVLDGMTYKEIKQNDAAARGYSVGYLSRYVAYHLWDTLTQVFQHSGVLNADEKVRSKNLWDCITRLMEREEDTNEAIEPSVSPQGDLLGQTLRMRYLITEHLVDGEFSHTYLAEDTDVPDGRLVVIKRLRSNSTDTLKRYQREAKVLQNLGKHDRIPELFARFEHDGDFYLVHEFIEGQPLSHELIAGESWAEDKAIALLRNILEILSFVHQQNIIHRDLHPDNLIRRASDGKIVPIDFGAVKEIRTAQTGNTTQTTTAVSLAGTSRYYISPEQAYGIPKLCSDLYAVGILGIQALTGVSPRKLKVNPKTGNPSWRRYAQVCPQLADVLDKMVCYDFRERYRSATEVLAALDGLEPCELRESA